MTIVVKTAADDRDAPMDPTALYHAFADAYNAACAAVGSISRSYRIAGYTVRLCFAGGALEPLLTPALAHLASVDAAPPDLTLHLWDGASTGSAPPRPWTAADIDLRGELPTFSNEQILTAIQPDVNAVSILDQRHSCGFYWIDSPASLRAYERAAPLKVLLHWWLRARGRTLIHAGAVGTADGAVLLVGKTGAGKSTTTLACLDAGLRYLADDRCLLTLAPTPQVACIYNSAKLHLAQMERFPALLAGVNNQHETATEKALIYLQAVAPERIAPALPIRALLLAKITGTTATSLAPVSRMALLRDFVSSTLVYQPGATHAEVHSMTELVRQVPCYQINLGSDLSGIAPVVVQAIERGAL